MVQEQNGGSNWSWNSWYNTIVRPSFYNATNSSWSSLGIDNYENSLYMDTVQGYMQDLKKGAINENCRSSGRFKSPTS